VNRVPPDAALVLATGLWRQRQACTFALIAGIHTVQRNVRNDFRRMSIDELRRRIGSTISARELRERRQITRAATAICQDSRMDIQMLADSPRNERGAGQVSRLLLAEGQFDSRRLCVTWVECQPGSQQALHRHQTQEQIYVIVRGRGQMLVGGEEHGVGPGTLVFIPPGTEHAIRNDDPGTLVYLSATAPPFSATIAGQTWEPRGLTGN
jgi:mannose-6-phosphate isomerase-like protein (cupin superfamily)